MRAVKAFAVGLILLVVAVALGAVLIPSGRQLAESRFDDLNSELSGLNDGRIGATGGSVAPVNPNLGQTAQYAGGGTAAQGKLFMAHVPIDLAGQLRPGDTIDVFALVAPAMGAQGFQVIAHKVTLGAFEVSGAGPSLFNGLVRVPITLQPTAEQAAQIGVYESLVELGVAVTGIPVPPEPTPEAGGLTSELSDIANTRSVTLGGCKETYTIGGVEMEMFVTCPPPRAEDTPEGATLISQLKDADLAFNRPDTMTFGQEVLVELVLAPDEVGNLGALPDTAGPQEQAEAIGLSPELAGRTRVVEDVQFSTRMQAELSGLDFDISPSGPQLRTVLPDRSVKWVWTVKPTAFGETRVLTLDVQALISKGTDDLPPVQIHVFREEIPVEISLWSRLVMVSEDVSAVHAMIVALGGTIMGVAAWLWKKRRKQKVTEDEEDDDPLEVIITHKIED
ncbi:hypothetical protein [Tropicimonas sp. S265A]|uniref:hypothetical protein n=1 Tax=Tropicimonas sp. S265A TaxID=3415134 RepID=UPI003C7A9AEC